MTREQLLALGYTEEQVNQIMALHGQATQSLKDTIASNTATITKLTTDLETALKSQPTPKPNTEPAPVDPKLTEALDKVAQLESEMRRKDIAVYASSKQLTGEQADNILKAFGDDVDIAKSAIDSIAQIISDTDKSARDAEKQALLKGTPNPSGGAGGGTDKTSAEQIASKLFGGKKQENNIISHYVNGGN